MSALWDPQQREWLQAMGYRVWQLGGDEPPVALDDGATRATPAAPMVAAEPVTADRMPSAAPAAPAPRSVPHAIAERVEPADESPPAPPAPTGAERRLHRALLRAAGQRTTRAAEALLAQLHIDLHAMRDDPAAKRALWPRLRALRKASERR